MVYEPHFAIPFHGAHDLFLVVPLASDLEPNKYSGIVPVFVLDIVNVPVLLSEEVEFHVQMIAPAVMTT